MDNKEGTKVNKRIGKIMGRISRKKIKLEKKMVTEKVKSFRRSEKLVHSKNNAVLHEPVQPF
jgi:hypothetical protein